MKRKNYKKIIMNIIDEVIKTRVLINEVIIDEVIKTRVLTFLQFLAFVVTVSLNYLQKYIASFTAQPEPAVTQ